MGRVLHSLTASELDFAADFGLWNGQVSANYQNFW